MQITKGEGKEGRIYERLRKRSYRKMLRNELAWEAYFAWEGSLDRMPATSTDAEYEAAMANNPGFPSPDYDVKAHKAYVAGARDALEAAAATWGWV